jgi:hypothetical protein
MTSMHKIKQNYNQSTSPTTGEVKSSTRAAALGAAALGNSAIDAAALGTAALGAGKVISADVLLDFHLKLLHFCPSGIAHLP